MSKTIEDIVSDRPFVAIRPDESVRMGCALLHTHGLNALAVLTGATLLGVFGSRDVVSRVVASWRDVDLTRVGDVMDASPVTVSVKATAEAALEVIMTNQMAPVVVHDKGRTVGMLSLEDMVDMPGFSYGPRKAALAMASR